jgi:PAS domain-containing protein
VLLSVSLVRDATGDPLYFVGQVQDITARKQVERQLVESELRYRTIADLVPGITPEMLHAERPDLVRATLQACVTL